VSATGASTNGSAGSEGVILIVYTPGPPPPPGPLSAPVVLSGVTIEGGVTIV
jgi:hypothetical protein